jgi:MFS family permease
MALQSVWIGPPFLENWRRYSSWRGGPSARGGKDALRHDLRAIFADAVTFSLMVGLGEAYLPAFVLALGLGGIQAGMIATVPVMLGAILQLVSPWAVQRLRSRRRWVVACSRCQAASLALLALLAATGVRQSWPIFVLATLYWASGQATGPAWNRWVESLVPKRIRARFFASRVRISQVATMTGLLIGGLWLNCLGSPAPSTVFAMLFAVAAIARIVSAGFLARQSEPVDPVDAEPEQGLLATLANLRGNANTALLVYLLAVQIAVYTSGPYFSPYMLTELGLSYLPFVILIGLAFLGKVLALPAWGRFAKRFGARRLLWAGGFGIVPIAALWSLSDNLVYLGALQVVSGIVWAAYELAVFLLLFDGLPRSQRTSLLTLYNLGSAVAMVGGGLLGAAWLSWWGQGHTGYLMLFAGSSLARIGTLALLMRVPGGLWRPAALANDTVVVRPPTASVERPILPALEQSA